MSASATPMKAPQKGPTEAEIEAAWTLLENAGYKVIAPRVAKPPQDTRMIPYHRYVTDECAKAGLVIKNWVVNPKDYPRGTGVYYPQKPLPRNCVARGDKAVAGIRKALGDKVLSVTVHPGQAGPVTKIEVRFNLPEEVKTK
jgi:hypothetical protein